MKLVFPAKLDFLSRFTWSIITTIIIVLTVTIIVTEISWDIFIINVIVMDMTIMAEVRFANAVTAGGSKKIFASGVNFFRNNAINDVNESTKYVLSLFYL